MFGVRSGDRNGDGTMNDMNDASNESTAARTKTAILDSIEKIVTVGARLRFYWFRGQDCGYGNLTPGIFRDDSTPPSYSDREINCVSNFMRQAPAYGSQLPKEDAFLDWLIFMQHHRLPTRLLDWTESILVATYFAAVSSPNNDGEVWAMFPFSLNSATVGRHGLPPLDNPMLTYLATEPFFNHPLFAMQNSNVGETPGGPIAFMPTLTLRRMVSQMSAFTIHPRHEYYAADVTPISDDDFARVLGRTKSIEQLLPERSSLVRYIIPSCAKPEILLALEALGVNEGSLFVDLDSLSRTIRREISGTMHCKEVCPPFTDD